jgi:peptide/nickel transport system ATP-binding protein
MREVESRMTTAAPNAAPASHGTPAIEVKNLSMVFDAPTGPRTILDDISFKVHVGETIGIVGESGSGKSMTMRAIMQLLPPRVRTSGSIMWHGRELSGTTQREMRSIRGGGISLLLQDPFTMLNPLLRCGDIIEEGLRLGPLKGASKKDLLDETLRRLAEVGIRDAGVAQRYPFQLSGGMRQRVALAASLARDPDILIADEPSTALDVTTQAEILDLLGSLQESRQMSLILITHDLRVAFSVCDRVYVLYAGSMLESGPAENVSVQPKHPYTLGLLLSDPPLDRRALTLTAIDGSVPPPDSVRDQCTFAARCRWVQPKCLAARPTLAPVGIDQLSACARLDEISVEMGAERARTLAAAPEVSIARVAVPLLTVTELVKSFPPARRGLSPVLALRGVDITVGENESVGIVGESGSGKTTLGRCIVGLETPTSGRINLAGIQAGDPAKLSSSMRKTLRRTAQIVFQDPYSSLDPKQTIAGALTETIQVSKSLTEGSISKRVDELLEIVGLPLEYRSRRAHALSGGERQRVAIARALAVDPRLLVCDEPVSALDVSVQAQILNLLRTLREQLGISYLFITHDLAVVRQVVDRVYVMHQGVVVEQGLVADVLDNPQNDYTRRLVSSIPRSPFGDAVPVG